MFDHIFYFLPITYGLYYTDYTTIFNEEKIHNNWTLFYAEYAIYWYSTHSSDRYNLLSVCNDNVGAINKMKSMEINDALKTRCESFYVLRKVGQCTQTYYNYYYFTS